MKKYIYLFFLIFLFQCKQTTEKEIAPVDTFQAKPVLDFIVKQYKNMMPTVPENHLPRNTKPDGNMRSVKAHDWTSGFYPGVLWYLYEYSKEEQFKKEAFKKTALIEGQKGNTSTHDLGFMLYNSFGNGLRIANVDGYRSTLITGAESLAGRYNDKVACIKSWDWSNEWKYPVIVDNMMNLEYLFWASNTTGDTSYYNIAVAHANKTMANHYRSDFSSYHLVDYDPTTGEIIEKITVQGYADESAWARGQAWGLYGFTMMYRETKDKKYLDHAQKIADFLLTHPNLPKDLIPYWDYNAPNIPNAPRDVSAATIIASALLELKNYTDENTSKNYFSKAEKILESLSSDNYFAKLGENNNFSLMHSVGHLPGNSEIDTPIIYADYYFVEALLRYLKN